MNRLGLAVGARMGVADVTPPPPAPVNLTPPVIAVQADLPSDVGNPLYMSEEDTWSGTVTSRNYQWCRNGEPIIGQQNPAFIEPVLTGIYTLMVQASNSGGSAAPVESTGINVGEPEGGGRRTTQNGDVRTLQNDDYRVMQNG